MSMVISRTPYRVSFFGGGTDYHPWYHEHGGAVLATSINKYCYIHCRTLPPFFDHRSRVVWSRIELVDDHADILHPVIRAALAMFDVTEGVEIHHHGDLPARSGVGSSSAFTVGMLHTVHALRGRMVSNGSSPSSPSTSSATSCTSRSGSRTRSPRRSVGSTASTSRPTAPSRSSRCCRRARASRSSRTS